MAHYSGETAPGYRSWLVLLLRVVAPLPVLACLSLSVWVVVDRGDQWVRSLIVFVVVGVSWVPIALSAYAGQWDPAPTVRGDDEPD